jgi:vacuolar-type H+-ATPase subunit C/Vma6
MMRPPVIDRDYLCARLHARRSRIADGERLQERSRSRSLAELARTLNMGRPVRSAAALQREVVTRLGAELADVMAHLEPNSRMFIAALLSRLQVENTKVLLRAHLLNVPPERVRASLIPLPAAYTPDVPALLAAPTWPVFIAALPPGRIRDRLFVASAGMGQPLIPFLLETALESGYLEELMTAARQLALTDQEEVAPLLRQEVWTAQFLAVLRGRFHYHLPAAALQHAMVPRKSRPARWLRLLLEAPDAATAAALGYGVVLDRRPAASALSDIAHLEALTWKRYARLATQVFRRSQMGIGTVAGYFGLRRVEVANLITLSEGIRLGLEETLIFAHLITPTPPEATHV